MKRFVVDFVSGGTKGRSSGVASIADEYLNGKGEDVAGVGALEPPTGGAGGAEQKGRGGERASRSTPRSVVIVL